MFTNSQLPWNVNSLVKSINADFMKFDLEVQRRAVWTKKQKQDLIDSLLFNFPVPPIYLVDKGITVEVEPTKKSRGKKKLEPEVVSILYVADGQQRGRTIHEYCNNKFPLAKNLEPYVDVDGTEYAIAGMFYEELPIEVKNNLNAVNLTTFTLSGMTDLQIAKMFKRLNAGTAMRKIELTRVDMPTGLTELVNELSQHEFFTSKIAVSPKAKNHFLDQEVILQTLMLLSGKETGFSGREIANYVNSYKETSLEGAENESSWHEEDFRLLYDRAVAITNYVNDAFDVKYKYLKKTNLPVIFKVAEGAMNDQVSPDDFWRWADKFYETLKPDSAYGLTLTSNSAKKDNVQKRFKLLHSNYIQNIVKTEPSTLPTITTEPDEGTEPVEGTAIDNTAIEDNTTTEPTTEPVKYPTTKKNTKKTTTKKPTSKKTTAKKKTTKKTTTKTTPEVEPVTETTEPVIETPLEELVQETISVPEPESDTNNE